jgi:hypothetical protein
MVAAVLAAGLVGIRGARAEDPCANDVKQFCGDVKGVSGKVQECLRQNEARLSVGCKVKRAAAHARLVAHAEEFAKACGRDVQRLCGEVKAGSGRVLACLIRQQDDLTSSCQPAVERVQAAAEKIVEVRAACKADAERLCGDVGSDAGPLVECLEANRASLSETCRVAAPDAVEVPAELVDAVRSAHTEEGGKELLQILQGIESTSAFSRSQAEFQFDTYQGLGGSANADRLLFTLQIVFGGRHDFAFQLRAPVFAVYPYAPGRPAQTGLGAVDTALSWALPASARVHQFVSFGLQWISPVNPPVGAAWAVNPGYAISVALAQPISVTGQVAWIRSFASSGFPEVDLLILEPIIVVNLPGRAFLSLDSRLGWNFVDSSFLPVIKGIAGLYLDRRKSVSLSAWYQALLSNNAQSAAVEPGTLSFKFGVGTAIDYYFDW